MSAQDEKGLELKVGFFVLIGLLFIAFMAVKFGQIGQGFKKFYSLTVEFPNASGLIKNSDVQLAGARIGYVSEKPVISASADSVTVAVKVSEGIKIPRGSKFQVNSSGLLGDKFVEIVGPPEFDPAKFDPNNPEQVFKAGETIRGSKAAGLDLEALQAKVETQLEKITEQLTEEMTKLKSVTEKIDNDVLSEANRKNIAETFANLKTSSANFSETSKNLDVVVKSAQGAVDSAKETMTTANAAAADLRTTIGTARNLLNKAQSGEGAISTLLNNKQLSENLKALAENLRKHGVLFYKDRAPRVEQPEARPRR